MYALTTLTRTALFRISSLICGDLKSNCVSDPCSDKTYLNLDGTCCEDQTHSVVFVLDESGSIGSSDFAKCVQFIKGITEELNSNEFNSQTKIGLVGFSKSGYEYSKLT